MKIFDGRQKTFHCSSRYFVRLVGSLILFACLPVAGRGALPVNNSPRPTVTVPKATLKPLLTAQPDDPAWSHAVTLPEMTPSLGSLVVPALFLKTSVLLMWDPEYLYVRFVCRDREIYAPVHGRDAPLYQGDAVEVFLDPVGDARQWVELEFNADNDVLDKLYLCTAEARTNASLCLTDDILDHNTWECLSWNMAGLISKAARMTSANNEHNWIVDIAIPAKELLRRIGLNQFSPITMRGDFLRYKWLAPMPGAKRQLLPLNWSPVILGCPHHSPTAYGFIILAE